MKTKLFAPFPFKTIVTLMLILNIGSLSSFAQTNPRQQQADDGDFMLYAQSEQQIVDQASATEKLYKGLRYRVGGGAVAAVFAGIAVAECSPFGAALTGGFVIVACPALATKLGEMDYHYIRTVTNPVEFAVRDVLQGKLDRFQKTDTYKSLKRELGSDNAETVVAHVFFHDKEIADLKTQWSVPSRPVTSYFLDRIEQIQESTQVPLISDLIAKLNNQINKPTPSPLAQMSTNKTPSVSVGAPKSLEASRTNEIVAGNAR